MRSISYRAKARIKTGFKVLLACIAGAILLVILLTVYLGRFVVYGPDGAHLDFSGYRPADEISTAPETEEARNLPDVSILYVDPNNEEEDPERISGYYIDLEMLQNPDAVYAAVQELSGPTTVMIDLKGGNGSFYYSTQLEDCQLAAIDIPKVDAVISYLKTHGFTMIARIRTFADTAFAEKHVSCALVRDNGNLWVGNGFYWLNPENRMVISYLKEIAKELAGKGFKEIVFDDFYFPSGTSIVYSSAKTRTELIGDAATELLNFFANSNITISFGDPGSDFAVDLPSRIYVSDVLGSGVNAAFRSFTELEDPMKQIVFLTGSKDNRFEEYQVLRPLLSKLVG